MRDFEHVVRNFEIGQLVDAARDCECFVIDGVDADQFGTVRFDAVWSINEFDRDYFLCLYLCGRRYWACVFLMCSCWSHRFCGQLRLPL